MANGLGYFDLLAFDGSTSSNISFYCIPHEMISMARSWYINDDTELNCLIPPYSSVMQAFYYPYLYTKLNNDKTASESPSDVRCVRINVNPAKSAYTDTVWENGKAFRILPMNQDETYSVLRTDQHTLCTFKGLPTKPNTVGGVFNWRNESKLYTAPFRILEVKDGLSTPLLLQPQFLPKINLYNDSHSLRVYNSINQSGQYGLYVYNYQNTSYIPQNLTLTSGVDVPVLNNTYLDYLYSSKNEIKAQRNQAYVNGFITAVSSVGTIIAAAAGPLTGGLSWAAIGATAISGVTSLTNQWQNQQQMKRKEQDMAYAPNTITALNTDYNMSMKVDPYLRILEHRYYDETMERIGYYFHMFGYNTDRVEVPNINSRRYWNYLKCTECNLKGTGVPKEHLLKLKQIFESGTTIWHINNSADVGNYSSDNPEVY